MAYSAQRAVLCLPSFGHALLSFPSVKLTKDCSSVYIIVIIVYLFNILSCQTLFPTLLYIQNYSRQAVLSIIRFTLFSSHVFSFIVVYSNVCYLMINTNLTLEQITIEILYFLDLVFFLFRAFDESSLVITHINVLISVF